MASLYYDQVGSLRVVADAGGNMIKEILYGPFGGIIKDSNPGLCIPIGFAGGLHDRDLGFVRFGWRDYDTFTSRWTAPNPLDWYGYCLDDPVDLVDPSGLMGSRPEPPSNERVKKRYWKFKANPGACDKCQALDGAIFLTEPGPAHPNCRCGSEEIWMTDQEAAEYKEWAPSLLLPKDDPRRRGAEYELRERLKGFAEGFLELPDPWSLRFRRSGNE